MKVWKVIFLFKNVIFRFHVCFLGGRWRFLEYVLFSPRKLGKKPPICFIFFRWVGSTTNQLITMNGTRFGGEDNCFHMFVWGNSIIYFFLFGGKDVFFLHLCCLGKRIVDIILFRGNNCWHMFVWGGKDIYTLLEKVILLQGSWKKMYLCHWMGKFLGKVHMDTLKIAIRQKLEIPSIF